MSTVIGIDIGYDTLKLAGLIRRGSGFHLVGLVSANIPANSWTKEELKNREEIAEVIHTARRNAKPKAIEGNQAMIALPETGSYTGTLIFPKLNPSQLEQVLPLEIAERFAINLEEYYVDYESVSSNCQPVDTEEIPAKGAGKNDKTITAAAKKQISVFAVAARISLVQSVLDLGKLAGLEIAGIDIKPAAIVRSLVGENDNTARLVVDLGISATGLMVAEGQSLRMTTTVPIGTRNLADGTDAVGKNLKERASPIFDELIHVTKYFENRLCVGGKIKSIILTGGGSNIEGIVDLFHQETGLTTKLGNPTERVNLHGFPIPSDLGRTYTDAIGLAMRPIR